MVKQFLKIAGVKTQNEFYKKYPTEEAFFRAHPEAQQLVHQKMAYGGGMYAYQDGGMPSRGAYGDNEEQYQADMDSYIQSMEAAGYPPQAIAMPQVGTDGMTDFIRRPAEPAPVAAAPVATQQHFALNPYEGVSVYDMLTAQGKAGDYNSRKALAKSLGISGYRGSPDQNIQMMEMIRQNPNILLNYTGAPAPILPPPSKAKPVVSKSKAAAKTTSTDNKREISKDNYDYLFSGYKSEYDFGAPKEAQLSASKTAVTSGSGKVDPYLSIIDKSVRNKAMTDYSTQQHFNEQLQKGLGKITLGAGALATGAAAVPGYGMASEILYPFNPLGLPEVTSAARAAGRAIPYATRALGWGFANGGAYGNVPQHGRPQGPNDGTYYQGNYFGAGGSYNPTSVDYGDFLPQFAMGYNIPEAMYGMGMAYGGTPCYNCGGMYSHGGKVVKGGEYDMSEEEIQDLINKGYKIQYI